MSRLIPTPEEQPKFQAEDALAAAAANYLSQYATRTAWNFTHSLFVAHALRFGSEDLQPKFEQAEQSDSDPSLSRLQRALTYGREDVHMVDLNVSHDDEARVVFFAGLPSGVRGFGLLQGDNNRIEEILPQDLNKFLGLETTSRLMIALMQHDQKAAEHSSVMAAYAESLYS